MLNFAANLSMMFTDSDFLDRFARASKAGFKYVEFLFPYDYPASLIKQKLDENGLKQVLFNTSAGDVSSGQWGRAAIVGLEQQARQDIQQALDYALALQCPNVHIMSGVINDPNLYAKSRQTFIENIRFASELFKPYGINILLEALSPQIKPNYLIKSQFQMLELVNEIDRDNVFIQLDFFHAQNVDGNLTRIIEQMQGRYAHIQVASVPDRHEIDEGEVNYDHIFQKLKEVNYQGYIGLEYNPRAKTEDGLGFMKKYQ